MFTEDEVKALTAILDKAFEEAEDGDPEYQEVNIKDVNPFPDVASLALVYEALGKRDLIGSSILEDVTGKHEEFVHLTPEGVQALKAAKGVH